MGALRAGCMPRVLVVVNHGPCACRDEPPGAQHVALAVKPTKAAAAPAAPAAPDKTQ